MYGYGKVVRVGWLTGVMVLACGVVVQPVLALRILPAGDSITLGLEGTNDNIGYRGPLKDMIDTAYPKLAYEFVGTVGPSPIWHEGYSGAQADPVIFDEGLEQWVPDPDKNLRLELLESLPEMATDQSLAMGQDVADVVLLHIGTNTMKRIPAEFPDEYDESPDYAIAQLNVLLDVMLNHERLDEATIFVARIIPRFKETNLNKREEVNQRVDTYNGYIDDLFAGLADGDNTDPFDPYADRLRLVDMNVIPGVIWGTDTNGNGLLDTKNSTYLPDGEHPADPGYEGMAGVWFDALDAQGYLSTPIVPGDADGDGDVDLDDFNILSAHMYQATGGGVSAGDFNNDGQVDLDDYVIQALHFGEGVPEAPGIVPIPEPGMLTGLAGIALLVRRRRSFHA